MSRVLYLCSGNYGAGKTHWAHLTAGKSGTVALASPIRRYLFKLFHDDRVHSTDQSVKESRFPKTPIVKLLRRDTPPPKFPKRLFIEFQHSLADKESLDNVSVRDLLILMGDAGRRINSNFWVNETKKYFEGLGQVRTLACDDVRFLNEKVKLAEWAKKNYITPIHVFIGEPDEMYDNKRLFEECDYRVGWLKLSDER